MATPSAAAGGGGGGGGGGGLGGESFLDEKERRKLDNKNSRMNAALGADTTAKMMKLKCLLVGIRGVGVETAKNLALQGTGYISVYDPSNCEMKDLGLNFFINAQDVAEGKKRADAVLPRLKELNPTCKMQVVEDLSDVTVLAHDALIITRFMPLTELVRLDTLCRTNQKSFYYGYTSGINSCIFVDHGDNHQVVDFNGVRPVQKLIQDITPIEGEDQCLVRYSTPEGQAPIAISEGDFQIDEVEGGCAEALNQKIFAVEHKYRDPVLTVRVPVNISSMEPYQIGGILLEKKMPKPYPMKSLAEKIKDPGQLVSTDLSTFSEQQQHLAFVATSTFAERRGGTLPRIGSAEDAAEVVAIAKELLASKEVDVELEPDEALITKYALFASVELQPMAAFMGGVLAQEVVKCQLEVLAPTKDGESKVYFGKFTPIPGFMHMSTPESLPDVTPTPEDTAPRNDRNDELAAVYGWTFVEKLGNLRYFLVGCGALGCEFMKNFALNGVCCGPDGLLIATDNDRIELSNLTRQFLFREHNVGQSKSMAAGAMATVMNSNFKVHSLEMFVGAKTENHFNDAFWLSLDGVCNALDNMEARLYVDGQCVKYERSLLESGTTGTDGNVDTISPFKTRTYADGGGSSEGAGIPFCTLRNFPHLTDHCIEWARDQFGALFVSFCKKAEAYLNDHASFESAYLSSPETGLSILEINTLISFMRVVRTPTIEMVVALAFNLFHGLFRDKILDLHTTFPRDARSFDKSGNDIGPFWDFEKKRFPKVLAYDPSDEAHTSFMISTTCLFAANLGIVEQKQESQEEDWCAQYRSAEWINSVIATLTPPAYIQAPVSGVEGVVKSEQQMEAEKVYRETQIRHLLDELRDVSNSLEITRVEPAAFGKVTHLVLCSYTLSLAHMYTKHCLTHFYTHTHTHRKRRRLQFPRAVHHRGSQLAMRQLLHQAHVFCALQSHRRQNHRCHRHDHGSLLWLGDVGIVQARS